MNRVAHCGKHQRIGLSIVRYFTAYKLNNYRMRTVHLLFFILLVCQTTESLTDKQVNLGQNVTLDCQIDVSDVYWVFQKLTDSPALILRTFSSGFTSSLIQDERFKDKYSSLTLSRLFISNITIDKLGIYYCVKTTDSGLRLSNGTRLYITESVQDHNQTENQQQTQSEIHNILTVTSFLLNIVLIIAIIVLLIFKLKKPTKSRQHRQNVEPDQLEDFNPAQFSEVEFRLFRPTNNTFGIKPDQE